jgi:predicted protein tyrosine phosphatase
MRLIGCALADLEAVARRRRPSGVVSLLGPDQPEPSLALEAPRLVLRFNDIDAPRAGLTAPSADTVGRLLAFAAGFDADAAILLHCWMGVSRAPAACFILACAQNPARPEAMIAHALRQAAPSATPNPLLVRLADQQMARRGRMSAAIALIGRGRQAASGRPFELEA